MQSEDELKADLANRLTHLSERLDRERLAQGWTQTDEGDMIPPGWIYVGIDAAGGRQGAG